MGNAGTRCLTLSRRLQIDNSVSFLIGQDELLIINNPISTALRMVNTPNEDEVIRLSMVLTKNVASIMNSDQTEIGLESLMKYLLSSLPMNCSLTGSVSLLILSQAALPSKMFLDGVSQILQLKPLLLNLDNYIKKQKRNKSYYGDSYRSDSICLSNNRTDGYGCRVNSISNCDNITGHFEDLQDAFNVHQMILNARNACLILDCLATLCCGPNLDNLLNKDIIDFLLVCCRLSIININEPYGYQIWNVVLRSILCLERFALTRNCKNTICEYIDINALSLPFRHLELYNDSKDMMQREVGFVSQWLLDNIYTSPSRTYTYLKLDRTNLNAIMNMMDASQYIKLSPIGLEVRSDSDHLESVRCTFKVTKGTYYYEVKLVTCGIMQIGWATKDSQFMTHEGQGIGDDLLSMGFDGFRQVIWNNAVPLKVKNLPKWESGDILGCLINVSKKFVVFSLNGKCTKKQYSLFSKAKTGFFAAASLINNQQCLFNFGREPFKYPPKCPFNTFNRDGHLDAKSKIILPRTIQMAEMNQSFEEIDDPCGICFNVSAEVCLEPCNHTGFCKTCISRVEFCPLCRCAIKAIKSDPIYFPVEEGESSNYRPPSRIVSG